VKEKESREKEAEEESRLSTRREKVKVGENTFYTDEALDSLVNDKQMSYAEAVKHQQDRLIAQAEERTYARIKKEQKEEEDRRLRSEDSNAVFRQYPQFSRTLADGSLNPDFNPEDPLYKEASRIYANGYNVNPKGLSLAIAEAKRILGIVDGRVDMTDQMSVSRSKSSNLEHRRNEVEVTISPEEEEAAIRMYTRGDVINPKTGRAYTEKEAIEKAKDAKARRAKK
jgi:hypothetical protein